MFQERTMASLLHDTNYIQNVAGCTPGCKRTEYSAKLFKMSHDPSLTDKFRIALFFSKDMFPVKEHFYVYDGGSLFADVGGYLGLLLGYSVLHLTKLVNPLLSLATSCYTAACSVCTLDTGDSVHSLKQ